MCGPHFCMEFSLGLYNRPQLPWLEALEVWLRRRMLKIQQVTNEQVLRRANSERDLTATDKLTKTAYMGHLFKCEIYEDLQFIFKDNILGQRSRGEKTNYLSWYIVKEWTEARSVEKIRCLAENCEDLAVVTAKIRESGQGYKRKRIISCCLAVAYFWVHVVFWLLVGFHFLFLSWDTIFVTYQFHPIVINNRCHSLITFSIICYLLRRVDWIYISMLWWIKIVVTCHWSTLWL